MTLKKMQTWCIYIDESGVNERQFIYAAICVPFNSQQNFLKAYPEIVKPLVGSSRREIKYGPLLNSTDSYYQEQTEQICQNLLTHFLEIKDAHIIRVKAIRKKIRHEGDNLRAALFRKTLELCMDSLPPDPYAMILHDELGSRDQQRGLLDMFNKDLHKYPNFQNCVFVHSNENPFIQFADFVAAICYRYYYFQQGGYKDKQYCKSLVNSLFEKIDEHCPPIVELSSEHQAIEGTPRRDQALQLASEHNIDVSTAYQIVDKNITLEKVLRQKQASQLASEHEIRLETAYQIVDKNITLEKVLRQKQASQLASEHSISFATACRIVDKNITLEEVLRQK